MKALMLVACAMALGTFGCTSSHSWTQVERTYAVAYSEVFARIPTECQDLGMTQKSADPEAGLIVLDCHRTVEKALTGSLLNMFAGDEIIVKAQRVSPLVTKIWVDCKARGQLGPDMGRTDRAVAAFVERLDKLWAIADTKEELGDARPVAATQPGDDSRQVVATQPAGN